MNIKNVICTSLVTTIVSTFAIAAHSADFSYDSVLPIYLKFDTSLMPEDIVDSYMEKYRPEVWKKYREDEFELEEKRAETLGLMKNVISSANTEEVFTIQTQLEFGDYNFDKQKFDFRPFDDKLFFPLDNCCNDLPRRIRVSFMNPSLIDGISMPKDQAKAFLNARKSSGGYIDRTVLAKLNIVMREVPSRGDLKSEIQSLEIYDREGRTLITTFTKSNAPSN